MREQEALQDMQRVWKVGKGKAISARGASGWFMHIVEYICFETGGLFSSNKLVDGNSLHDFHMYDSLHY
jgi:hypothetical protein